MSIIRFEQRMKEEEWETKAISSLAEIILRQNSRILHYTMQERNRLLKEKKVFDRKRIAQEIKGVV
jgi:hypothetical protein